MFLFRIARLLAVCGAGSLLWMLGWATWPGGQYIDDGRPENDPPAAIIHEWSQGRRGSQEWVELLTMVGPLDLRGWTLGDQTAGDLAFADHDLWRAVPTGTVIVLFNGNAPDEQLPPVDHDIADLRLILPHNDPTLMSGRWPAFSNSTSVDNPVLQNAAGQKIHDFSNWPGEILHPRAGEAVHFHGNHITQISSDTAWRRISADAATPGSPNTPENGGWWSLLRSDRQASQIILSWQVPAIMTATTATSMTSIMRNVGTFPVSDLTLRLLFSPPVQLIQTDSIRQTELVSWHIEQLPAGETLSLTVDVQPLATTTQWQTATMTLSAAHTETAVLNPILTATIRVDNPAAEHVLIEAVHYYGQAVGQSDEAVRLTNVGTMTAQLEGWRLGDGENEVVLPAYPLSPRASIWVARDGEAFRAQFGTNPDMASDGWLSRTIPLGGRWPSLANGGDELQLVDAQRRVRDTVIFRHGLPFDNGQNWIGESIHPYSYGNTAVRGQILWRKRNPMTGMILTDTNRARDWMQDPLDPWLGRRILYPGWQMEQWSTGEVITASGSITMALAPDLAYETVVDLIERAQEQIMIAAHTFEHIQLAERLASKAAAGVEVIVLLEGGPPGGIEPAELGACARIEAEGGQCWFMINETEHAIYDRYRYFHNKYMIVDQRWALVSTENFTPESMPADPKSNGTRGRRGVLIVTDAAALVGRIQQLFEADWQPDRYRDLFRFTDPHPLYGPPDSTWRPIEDDETEYAVQQRLPWVTSYKGEVWMHIAPETWLTPDSGLLGVIGRTTIGDELLVQQLNEPLWWGDSTNPRVAAYIAAAQRGVQVRIALDRHFQEIGGATSNGETCHYLRQVADSQQLDLQCVLINPAGLGVHNKMVLIKIGGQGIIHLGSLNGSEQAHKGNRELAIMWRSDQLFEHLRSIFLADLEHAVYLPYVWNNATRPIDYPLITELLYDPVGLDQVEYLEITNPTITALDLGDYAISDAVTPDEFADTRRFPVDTILEPHQVIVVAQQANPFYARYHIWPDFELLDTVDHVPQLMDDPDWGDPDAFLQFGNGGDVVMLRDRENQVVDMVAYGPEAAENRAVCALVSAGYSLRRRTLRRDLDICSEDFLAWPVPDPGISR